MIYGIEQVRSLALPKGLFDRGEVTSRKADAAARGTLSGLAASQPADDDQDCGGQQASLGKGGRQGLTAVMMAVHREDHRRGGAAVALRAGRRRR
jgi:hypothetical protein